MKNLLGAALGIIVVAGIITWGMRYEKEIATPKVPDGWSTLKNTEKKFEFSYAPDSIVKSADELANMTWSSESAERGAVFAAVAIPKEFQPSTNFSEAQLSVGESRDLTAVRNCLKPAYANQATRTEVVNGTEYTILSGTGAGAGNYYETESYRVVRDEACVAIDLLIHSTNIMNYPSELNLHEFDRQAVSNRLHQMMATFRFVN